MALFASTREPLTLARSNINREHDLELWPYPASVHSKAIIQMFHNSQAVITGGSFNNYNFHGRRGMDRLEEAAVPGAFHNSLQRCNPPRCHKHTRQAILGKIMDWVMKKIDSENFIMWLYGAAGAGKTAIAQTIAELCEEYKLLLASFFFFRADSLRNNSKQLVATIAYQVAVVIPGVRGLMETVIENDPHLISRSLITQFMTLIVEPLEHLFEISVGEHLDRPNLIIIDGLDECMDGTQVHILDMIFTVGRRSKFPFIFLVASRPELEISAAMGDGRIREGLTRLPLDNDITAVHDIRHFFEDKFDEIRITHPSRSDLPSLWPSREDIKTLVYKSSGQFIYASTIVKFVSSRRHRPDHRLEMILGLRPKGKDLPFAELDALYRYILFSVEDTTMTVQILATILSLRFPGFIDVLAGILVLSPSEIKLRLIDLGSLVEVRGDICDSLHASLGDFLFDEARSQELYINGRAIHTKIIQAVLRDSQNFEGLGWWKHFVSLSLGNELVYHCSNAQLTPDLATLIRHFPLRQTSIRELSFTLDMAPSLMGFAKFIPSLEIERPDLISTRYLAEIDEALLSFLNSSSSFATGVFSALYLSDALVVHHFQAMGSKCIDPANYILVLHGLIFSFIYDDIHQRILDSFVFFSLISVSTLLFDFLSNPHRSQHHGVDSETHSLITERCFSYILNRRLAHLPGIRFWVRKSTRRPWLWRWRKPKGVITNVNSQLRWQQGAPLGCNKKVEPFWALVLALKYLPYLLNKATKSEELIALSKMWSYRPFLLSLFPRDAKKAGKAVRHYLSRFDGKRK